MVKKKVFAIGSALSQGLEEAIESAQSYSSSLRIDIIPIKKIELDHDNPRDLILTLTDVQQGIADTDPEKKRKIAELSSLQSMADSIKTQGIINPITVYKSGEKYRLVAGERRTLASLIANKTDIQAKILDDQPNELKISLLQWIENIERSDLSLWERMTNLEKIVNAYSKINHTRPTDITISELSVLIGCVKSHAMNYKIILGADEELKRLISENKIKNLEKAAFISGIASSEIRQQAIFACINGATLKQLKMIVEQNQYSIKKIDKRGRQTTAINLGITKNTQVAKVIIESILNNSSLMHLSSSFKNIDWNNHRVIAETFKQLLKTLEKAYN